MTAMRTRTMRTRTTNDKRLVMGTKTMAGRKMTKVTLKM